MGKEWSVSFSSNPIGIEKNIQKLISFSTVRLSLRSTKTQEFFRAETNVQRMVIGWSLSPSLPLLQYGTQQPDWHRVAKRVPCLPQPTSIEEFYSPHAEQGCSTSSSVDNLPLLGRPNLFSTVSILPWQLVSPRQIHFFWLLGFWLDSELESPWDRILQACSSLLFIINDLAAHLFCSLVKTLSSISSLHPLSPLSFLTFPPFLLSFFLTQPKIPS